MSKRIFFGTEALNHLQDGVDAVANAVKVTLGPSGRNVTMDREYGSPLVTKDGVSVARAVEFDDLRKIGTDALRSASIKTAEEAGDGTTSSMVMAQAIFSGARKAIAGGMHPIFLKRGMDVASGHAVSFIRNLAMPVENVSEIAKVATLSANGDEALGSIIAEAMEMVGKDGVIAVEESASMETYLEYSEGLQLDRGYLAFDFVANTEDAQASLENALVLLADQRISDVQEILPALELASRKNRPLMIVCHDLEGNALQACVQNTLAGRLQICAAKAPRIGEKRTQLLENLAILLGGEVLSQNTGNTLRERKAEDLCGSAELVTVTKDTTTFIGGHGDTDLVEDRIRTLRTLAQTTGSEHDKEFYQQQMSQMSGGIAIIRVGAATEIELKEYKARVEDALSATQAAVRGGIIPGGGCALLQASDYLSFLLSEEEDSVLEGMSEDERTGFEIVRDAMKQPFSQILRNAGFEPAEHIFVLRQEIEENPSAVFDARTGEIVGALESGIIDPALVAEQVVLNSISTAATLATASCIIANAETVDNSDLSED